MKIVHLIRSKFKNKALKIVQRITNKIAYNHLKHNSDLMNEIHEYIKKTKSTGCSYSDYWELYNFIRTKKPREVLECGTGVSTIVMAYALMENEKKDNIKGRITSMEEVEEWYHMAIDLIPESLAKYVDFVLSPRVEDYYSIFRGVRYRDVPNRNYEFMFIDGPNHAAPSDGDITFNFDIFKVIKKQETPVYAIVDKRVNTSYVLQKVFGLAKVKYSARHHLAFIGPCTKDDLKVIGGGKAFEGSYKLFGNSELYLKMKKPVK